MLLQQIRYSGLPGCRQPVLLLLQIRSHRVCQLRVDLLQPLLRQFDTLRVASAQQSREPTLRSRPRIGRRCGHHCPPGKRCQSQQRFL